MWQPYTLSLSHFSPPFMHLHLHYSTTSPAPPRLPLLYKTRLSQRGALHVYKTALLLVEESICQSFPNQTSFPFPLFLSFSLICVPFVSAIVLWNCCPHDLCRSLACASFLSRHSLAFSLPLSLVLPLPLYCLDDIFTLAAPTIDTSGAHPQ